MFFEFGIKDFIDILLVAFVLYYTYKLMKASGSIKVFTGILVFILIWLVVTQVLEMKLLGSIFDTLMNVGVIALIVLFQDEIRRFLLTLGSHRHVSALARLFNGSKKESLKHDDIMPVVMACLNMGKQKVGALIVIEHNVPLDEVVRTGELIDAAINQRLIENIFFKNSPLHDGAMVISKKRIKAAGCILPVSHDLNIPKELGLRHRAAMGISQQSDATGEGKPGLVGAQTAGPVLFDIFSYLPSSSWFERPTDVFVDAEICRQSGHLKGRFCEETDTVLILPAGLRTEACPYHHLVTLSADESHRIYENCANTEPTIQKSWFALPPVWEWYYKQHHPEYKPLPPFKAGCGEDSFQSMQFIYPPMNAHIKLPKQLDGSKGFLTVELAHSNPNATIFWHLDDTYQTQTQDFHKISLQPAPGKHSLTTVDGEGNTVSTTFFIE